MKIRMIRLYKKRKHFYVNNRKIVKQRNTFIILSTRKYIIFNNIISCTVTKPVMGYLKCYLNHNIEKITISLKKLRTTIFLIVY